MVKVLIGQPSEMEKLRIVSAKVLLAPRNSLTTLQRAIREVAAWQCLRHPNVLPFLGIASLSSHQFAPPGLVSPWIRRSKVLNWIGRHPEAKHQKVSNFQNFTSYADI